MAIFVMQQFSAKGEARINHQFGAQSRNPTIAGGAVLSAGAFVFCPCGGKAGCAIAQKIAGKSIACATAARNAPILPVTVGNRTAQIVAGGIITFKAIDKTVILPVIATLQAT